MQRGRLGIVGADPAADFDHPDIPDTHPALKRHAMYRLSRADWRARVAGNMVGQLFLRSYERSERVYNAMVARGYKGHFYTLNPHVMRSHDWVSGGIALTLLVIVQIIGQFKLF